MNDIDQEVAYINK